WSLGSGSTASGASVADGKASASGAGEVEVIATVANGLTANSDYTRTFTISFEETPIRVYTISFIGNGGAASAATAITGLDGKLPALPVAVRSNYAFNGWFTAATGGTQITENTAFASDTTVYAQWTFGGDGGDASSGGGAGGGVSTPSPTPTKQANQNLEAKTVPVENGAHSVLYTEQDGKVEIVVETSALEKIANTAKNDGIATINVSQVDGAKEVAVPAIVFAALTDNGVGAEVELPLGTLIIDSDALASVSDQVGGETVSIIVEDAKPALNVRQQGKVGDRPVYDVSIKSGNNYVTSFGGGVITVSIPYALKPGEKPNNIVVYYLDSDGNTEKMQTMYDAKTKSVIFSTTHLSAYYIAYEEWVNNYGDVAETAWYFEAVKCVSENGLLNGTDKGFEPGLNLTRAMMVTILYNYAQPSRGANATDFSDVPLGEWYSDPIAWAASSGIVDGVGGGKFEPNRAVTREEMMTILFRFAKRQGVGPVGNWAIRLDYADASELSDWASEAAMWTTMKGIVNGKPGNLLDSKGTATRAEAAAVLMRYIEITE
ncbi:MAG: S-layer homology domain-containing protein, partial [Clostridiales Family XIII bacterium]|nr:S-layer homology domain-containing protein [Clostridiales Family XIII bacterium]